MLNLLKRIWMPFLVVVFFVCAIWGIASTRDQYNASQWTKTSFVDGTQWEVQPSTGKIKPATKTTNSDGEPVFGAGYAPVTGFQTLTTSRVSAADTTIPVASVTDKAGNLITTSNISSSSTVRMYFNFEPGTSREEPFFCTGISGLNLTGCVRGIAFQGSDLTSSSTIAQIHNAGASVIMTNLGVFYANEFVAISGDQTIYDTKSFNSFPVVTSSSALPTANGQFATKLYVDNVGAGGFTAANVSSTMGLQANGSSPETVGINASTTQGLQLNRYTDGSIGINASSTASNNGGFLSFNTAGQIYWNIVNFLAGAWTWTGNQIFANNVTSTGSFRVQAPTSTYDATNKYYVDSQIFNNVATGTAGYTITPGQALFISSTSTLFPTDSSVGSSTYQFVGIAKTAATVGTEVSFTRPGGTNCSLTGLDQSASYFINGASGAVSSSPDTFFAKIGRSVSSNCIQVQDPKYIRSGSSTVSVVGHVTSTTNFFPARVLIRAGLDSVGGAESGMSIGDDSNSCVRNMVGNTAANSFSTTKAFSVLRSGSASEQLAGTVLSKTQSNFVINVDTANTGGIIYWTAYSE